MYIVTSEAGIVLLNIGKKQLVRRVRCKVNRVEIHMTAMKTHVPGNLLEFWIATISTLHWLTSVHGTGLFQAIRRKYTTMLSLGIFRQQRPWYWGHHSLNSCTILDGHSTSHVVDRLGRTEGPRDIITLYMPQCAYIQNNTPWKQVNSACSILLRISWRRR